MMSEEIKALAQKVITKEDFEYEVCRQGWNRGIEHYPLAIVYCQTEKDIQATLAYAKKYQYDLRIRSGGHHYEGYSNGHDVIVIDISKMNAITIDEQQRKVIIQGGVRNEALYKALGEKNYPFPGGGCPTVGVAGLTLGGGWGYSARFLGLAADSLLELELINADGKKVIANNKVNPELFWACKGAGGGQFGVVTKLTFKLPNKVNSATWIYLDYPHCTLAEKKQIIATWQEVFKTVDPRLNLKMSIYHSDERGKGIFMTGICYGDARLTHELLMPFKSLACSMILKLEEGPILKVNQMIQDSHPPYEKYKSNGRFLMTYLEEAEIEALVNLVEVKPEGAYYTALSFYGMGGKIEQVAKEDTAFYYREAKAIIGLQAVWEDQEAAPLSREWVCHQLKQIERYTEGAFVNFPLAELRDYETAYFGNHKERLRKIKTKYDSKNDFSFPQSISTNEDKDK